MRHRENKGNSLKSTERSIRDFGSGPLTRVARWSSVRGMDAWQTLKGLVTNVDSATEEGKKSGALWRTTERQRSAHKK